MTFTIAFGWWMLPALLTSALAIYALRPLPPAYGYGAIGNGLAEAIKFLFGLVAVLIAWLIWAVLT